MYVKPGSFIWYLLASLKKMSLAKHGELYFILASTCFSPFWRVFEKNGLPHCHDITEILLKVALNTINHKLQLYRGSVVNHFFQTLAKMD
jgi:hypothetical protein